MSEKIDKTVMMSRVEVDQRFTTEVKLPCTFCKGKLELVRDQHGEHALIHLSPVCKTFEDMELVEFMVANRRNLGIPDPPDERD